MTKKKKKKIQRNEMKLKSLNSSIIFLYAIFIAIVKKKNN